jgi:hypothetical protein
VSEPSRPLRSRSARHHPAPCSEAQLLGMAGVASSLDDRADAPRSLHSPRAVRRFGLVFRELG